MWGQYKLYRFDVWQQQHTGCWSVRSEGVFAFTTVITCSSMLFFVLFLHGVCLCLQAEDVRRVADNELGFQQVTLSRPTQAKTYMFINTERMVVGCLVAEPIRQVQLDVLVWYRLFDMWTMYTCDPASHCCIYLLVNSDNFGVLHIDSNIKVMVFFTTRGQKD